MTYLFIAVIAAFTLFCMVYGMAQTAFDNGDFYRRFPPISDDEFVARCTPGTSRNVALRVRRIVAEQLGVEYARVHPSTRFVEDLGAD